MKNKKREQENAKISKKSLDFRNSGIKKNLEDKYHKSQCQKIQQSHKYWQY